MTATTPASGMTGQQKVDAAQKASDYWHGVRKERSRALDEAKAAEEQQAMAGEGQPEPKLSSEGNEYVEEVKGIEQSINDVFPDVDKAVGRSMSETEAEAFMQGMRDVAETATDIELTTENWLEQFGENGIVITPIGSVKMGENQYFKLAQQGRNGKLGMVKLTLENPDVIIEDHRPAKDGNQEREYSYVFVKSFVNKDGERYYHFTSVTVQKDGKEVVISNQERRPNRISKLLQQGKVTWINERFSSHPNTRIEESVPLSDSNKLTITDNQPALLGINSPELSESKDNTNSANLQENGGVKSPKRAADVQMY